MVSGLVRRVMRRLIWGLLAALAGLTVLSVLWVLLYAVAPVPATPLMLLRAAGGSAMTMEWKPLSAISPHLVRAVVASEDSAYCRHRGFDWAAIQDALDGNEEGERFRGGSTISQQTAKNAFLWPGRTWIRKGIEAWFTVLIEALWDKRRILEVYLNVAEWDDGVYGAEAAAQHHFRKPADRLTRREAALLAVVLPSPRNWSPNPPGPYVARRAGIIERRMAVVEREDLAGCAAP